MRKLKEPEISAVDILDIASRQSESPLNETLQQENLKLGIESCETKYRGALTANNAASLGESSNVAGVLDDVTAKYVYDRLRSYKYLNGTVIDYLFGLARFTKCAYCGHAVPRQLDHYLPRGRYVEFSFLPINLIPSCANCNAVDAKGSKYPTSSDDTFFHPYFDDPDDGKWLFAEMSVDDDGLRIAYHVQRPDNWALDKFKRVNYTFKTLKLSATYAQDVVCRIRSIYTQLFKIYEKEGAHGVSEYFMVESQDRCNESDLNDWFRVAFEYLASHEDLCAKLDKWFPD